MKKNWLICIIVLVFLLLTSCNKVEANKQDIDKNANPPENQIIDDDGSGIYPNEPLYGLYYKEFEYEIEKVEYSEYISDGETSETIYLTSEEFESLMNDNQIDSSDLSKLSYMQGSTINYNDYFNYKVGDKVIDATFDKFGGNRDLIFDGYKKTHVRNSGNYSTANSWNDIVRYYTYEETDCRSMYSNDYDRDLLYASKLYVYDSYNLKIDGKMRIINILIELTFVSEK